MLNYIKESVSWVDTALRGSLSTISGRKILASIMLVASLCLLFLLLIWLLPYANNFYPTDYENLVQWGRDAQTGTFNYLYPLPALLYIFLPLSFMPWWFKFLWVALPFLFVLYLYRQRAVILFLSLPMLVQGAWGTIDGCFLLPLYWLFNDHPSFAGISAGVLLLKPQLAVFTVPYMLFKWYNEKNWKPLKQFLATTSILFIPAFFIDPLWPIKMIPAIQARQSQWFLPIRIATLWGWWWHGDWTVWALPFLIIVALILFFRAYHVAPVKALHLLGLLFQPVFFLVSLDTVIPTLRNSTRDFLILTLVSWIAFAVDVFMAWGGIYVLFSMTALWLLGRADAMRSEKSPVV